MKVWLNGKILDEKKAVVSVFDHAFLYGDGLYETVRVQAGEVLFEQSTMGELIYLVSEGELDIVRELADGGEELVKVAKPGDYFGEIGVLFHMPRSATVRARTDATVVGYTAQAFRERLGVSGLGELIEHRELAND